MTEDEKDAERSAQTSSERQDASQTRMQSQDESVQSARAGRNGWIEGGAGDDKVSGTGDDDTIKGWSGDDRLKGGDGDDDIDGDEGSDTIHGGAGDDTITGDDGKEADWGDDSIDGGAGNDRIEGHEGDDTLLGGEGSDTIHGNSHDDLIDGGAGDDSLDGGTGSDIIHGGRGDDSIEGGAGNDFLLGGSGADASSGGEGNDWIIDGAGDDTLDGGSGADSLFGGSGNDSVSGGAGDDRLYTSSGSDTLAGGQGSDTFTILRGTKSNEIADFEFDRSGAPVDRLDVSGLRGGSAEGGGLRPGDIRIEDAAGDARLVFPQGESMTLRGVSPEQFDKAMLREMGVPCFTPGTRIATDLGHVPVETLRPGDRVQTADDGLVEVLWTGRQHLSARDLAARPDLAPIRVAARALGNARAMLVSPQHRFRISGPALVEASGLHEAFLRARFLSELPGNPARTVRRAAPVTYVHILLERHAVIFAEGAATEPFWPGPQALRSLGAAPRAELFALFPGLAGVPDLPGPQARALTRTAYAPLARPELSRRDLRALQAALAETRLACPT